MSPNILSQSRNIEKTVRSTRWLENCNAQGHPIWSLKAFRLHPYFCFKWTAGVICKRLLLAQYCVVLYRKIISDGFLQIFQNFFMWYKKVCPWCGCVVEELHGGRVVYHEETHALHRCVISHSLLLSWSGTENVFSFISLYHTHTLT